MRYVLELIQPIIHSFSGICEGDEFKDYNDAFDTMREDVLKRLGQKLLPVYTVYEIDSRTDSYQFLIEGQIYKYIIQEVEE